MDVVIKLTVVARLTYPPPPPPPPTLLQSIIAHAPNADRMVSYICLYCGLQVLGMLWGFLVNVFASISLHISGYIMGRCAVGVKGMSATRFMQNGRNPSRRVEVQSSVERWGTVYIVFATVHVLMRFGSFTWAMSRDSLTEFPKQRRVCVSRPRSTCFTALLCHCSDCATRPALAVGYGGPARVHHLPHRPAARCPSLLHPRYPWASD